MIRLKRLAVMGCVAVATLLGGCQADVVDPQVSLSVAEAQLYQEAFDVYSKYFELAYAIEQQGGAESLPEELEQCLTGPELDATREMMRGGWEMGLQYRGVNVNRIEKWQPAANPEPGTPAILGITVCRSHQRTDLQDAEGTVVVQGSSFNAIAHVQFARNADGALKIYYIENETAEACPF